MTDQATLAARLVQAETALHKLLTGSAVVSVGYGEDRVQYRQADIGELRAYIQQLKVETGGTPRRGRAIGVRFG